MAERVDDWPRRFHDSLFDAYTDGAIWRLSPDDWKPRFASLKSAQAAARYYGRHRKYASEVRVMGDDLYVRFTKAAWTPDRPRVGREAKRGERRSS
jgi:hypothetical protein